MKRRRDEVFLHSISTDRATANEITAALRKAGFHARLHPEPELSRRSLALTIGLEPRTNRGSAHLVLLSPNYLQSPSFRSEWLALIALGYTLIPVIQRPTDIIEHVGGTVPILLREDAKSDWPEILRRAIQGVPGSYLDWIHEDEPETPLAISNLGDQDLFSPDSTLDGDIPALQELVQMLKESFGRLDSIRGRRLQMITGGAAAGKTQLASAFARAGTSDYDVVWWCDAQEPQQLAWSLNSLMLRLKAPAPDESDWPAITHRLDQWATDNGRRVLLIMDGVDDPATVIDYLPPSSTQLHTVITSRVSDTNRGYPVLHVDRLETNAAIDYLNRRTGRKQTQSAKKVAALFNGDTSALRQAACWARATDRSLASYYKVLSQLAEAQGAELTDPDTCGDLALQLALATAQESAAGVDELVAAIALISDAGVDLTLIEECLKSRVDFAPALLAGIAFGLVAFSEGLEVSVSTAVAARIVKLADRDSLRQVVRRLAAKLGRMLPSSSAPMRDLINLPHLAPHAIRLLSIANAMGADGIRVARLGIAVAQALLMVGDLDLAASTYRKVNEALRSARRSPRGEEIQHTLNRDLSWVMRKSGAPALEGAFLDEYYDHTREPLLAVDRKQPHHDYYAHLEELRSLHNDAVRVASSGDPQRATTLMQKVVDGRRSMLGDIHPETMRSLIALGIINAQSRDVSASVEILSACEREAARHFGFGSPLRRESLEALTYAHVVGGDTRQAIWAGQLAFDLRVTANDFSSREAFDLAYNLAVALLREDQGLTACKVLAAIEGDMRGIWDGSVRDWDAFEGLKARAYERLTEEGKRELLLDQVIGSYKRPVEFSLSEHSVELLMNKPPVDLSSSLNVLRDQFGPGLRGGAGDWLAPRVDPHTLTEAARAEGRGTGEHLASTWKLASLDKGLAFDDASRWRGAAVQVNPLSLIAQKLGTNRRRPGGPSSD